MVIALFTPTAAELPGLAATLASWQLDGMPVQLHPGDLGWAWQIGAEALAERTRFWSNGQTVVAIGMLDGPDLLRMAVAPEASLDERAADHILADLTDPMAGVLPEGPASVETRFGQALRQRMTDAGWAPGEAWTPLVRDLDRPVESSGLLIENVRPELAELRVLVQNRAFGSTRFTAERLRAASTSPLFSDARDLLAFDTEGEAVAVATVWSAGAGRPGLIEPMGVHPDHRGRGIGRGITLAAMAALRELGASTAMVCTPSANVGAVTTYTSAGMRAGAEVTDFARP